MCEDHQEKEYVAEERIVKCKRLANFWEAEVDPENAKLEYVDVFELRTVYKDESGNIVMWEPEATVPFGTTLDELLKCVADISEASSKEILDESEMGTNPLEELYNSMESDNYYDGDNGLTDEELDDILSMSEDNSDDVPFDLDDDVDEK